MIKPVSHPAAYDRPVRAGRQPIALAATVLLLLAGGIASVAVWRANAGTSTVEADKTAPALRQLQVRTVQVSEQLDAKTKSLEASQQESIDQLQRVQDQLAAMKRLVAAQQAENQRLSGQVAALTETVDGLRQSYASAQAEPSAAVSRGRSSRRVHSYRHRSRSRG